MALRNDPKLRTKLGAGQWLEIKLFEPLNENYAWKLAPDAIGTCEGLIETVKSEWDLAIDKDKDKFIYDRLPDDFAVPMTSLVFAKHFLSDNIGIRKLTLKAVKNPENLLKNCELDITYERTDSGTHNDKMQIRIP